MSDPQRGQGSDGRAPVASDDERPTAEMAPVGGRASTNGAANGSQAGGPARPAGPQATPSGWTPPPLPNRSTPQPPAPAGPAGSQRPGRPSPVQAPPVKAPDSKASPVRAPVAASQATATPAEASSSQPSADRTTGAPAKPAPQRPGSSPTATQPAGSTGPAAGADATAGAPSATASPPPATGKPKPPKSTLWQIVTGALGFEDTTGTQPAVRTEKSPLDLVSPSEAHPDQKSSENQRQGKDRGRDAAPGVTAGAAAAAAATAKTPPSPSPSAGAAPTQAPQQPGPQYRVGGPTGPQARPGAPAPGGPNAATAVIPAVGAGATADGKPADPSGAQKPKSAPARRTRKARLRLSRLDPWSVMKTSFLFSIAAGIMLVVAVYGVWTVLSTSGLFASVNEIVASVVSTPGDTTPFRMEDYLNTQRIMGVTALIACVDVVIFTALATLGSFLYNLAATMLGGLEITLAED